MSRPSAYQLLKDVQVSVNRVEDKLDSRIDILEVKVDENTNWRNQITGKLTILFIAIGIAVNFSLDWVRDKLRI